MTSYSRETAKKTFIFVTARGSFARNIWGESWTRNVAEAKTAYSEDEAKRVVKQINTRLGKTEVKAEPVYRYMKLCWGFSFDKDLVAQCVQRYFPKDTEVISEMPHPDPEAQKYTWPRDKAFCDPMIAWEHLRARRIYDLEFAQRSLDEINSDLRACAAALSPTSDEYLQNVVDLKRGDDE